MAATPDAWLAYLERQPEAVAATAAALSRGGGGAAAARPLLEQLGALGAAAGGCDVAAKRAGVSLRMLDATQPRLAASLRRHLLALTVLRTPDGRWAGTGGGGALQLRPWLVELCGPDHAGAEPAVAARAAATGAWALDISSAARLDALDGALALPQPDGASRDSAVVALCIRRLTALSSQPLLLLPPNTASHIAALDSTQRRLMISELCEHLRDAAPRWRPQLSCALTLFFPFYLSQLSAELEPEPEPESQQAAADPGLLAEIAHLAERWMDLLEYTPDPEPEPEPGPEPMPEPEPEPEPEPRQTELALSAVQLAQLRSLLRPGVDDNAAQFLAATEQLASDPAAIVEAPPIGPPVADHSAAAAAVDEQWSEDWSEQQVR